MPRTTNPLAGIAPADVVRSWHDRGIDRLTGFELLTHASDLLRGPKRTFSSFVLHAPLESMTRYSLLDLVSPEARALAGMQWVSLAARYQGLGDETGGPRELQGEGSVAGAVRALGDAIAARDEEAADAAAAWLAEHLGPLRLVSAVGDLLLDDLGAAAHTPIFLALLARVGPAAARICLPMFRGFARQLAREGDLRVLEPLDAAPQGPPLPPAAVERAVWEGMNDVPRLDRPQIWGIAMLVQSAQRAGLPERVLAWSGVDPGSEEEEAGFRATARVAVHSMLQDAVEHAKYGWSHCLTIPHAVRLITPFLRRRGAALRLAATVCSSLRAGLTERPLREQLDLPAADGPLADLLREGPERAAAAALRDAVRDPVSARRVIASEASIRQDAHLVKYVLTCLDASALDPEAAPLYYAAAAWLLAIWVREIPAGEILERLHAPA